MTLLRLANIIRSNSIDMEAKVKQMAQCKLAYSFDDDLNNKTDEQLVTFAKEGKEEALEYLFERYKNLGYDWPL